MRKTPFYRILAIYGLAILILPLWLGARQPIARSAKSALLSLGRALQIKRAYADLLDDSDSNLPVQDHEVMQKSFSVAGAAHKSIEIDNVFGSIEVVGGSSDQVQLVVDKTTRAESKDALALAHKEVTLDITQPDGGLKLYVDGPFRCQCEDGCRGSHRRDEEGYIVKMDFELHVPSNVDIKVKTVNEGRVIVRNITGNFTARNVNGDIELDGMAGSGFAHTVNGPVKVSFRENPRENSSFQSVNGNIDLLSHGVCPPISGSRPSTAACTAISPSPRCPRTPQPKNGMLERSCFTLTASPLGGSMRAVRKSRSKI